MLYSNDTYMALHTNEILLLFEFRDKYAKRDEIKEFNNKIFRSQKNTHYHLCIKYHILCQRSFRFPISITQYISSSKTEGNQLVRNSYKDGHNKRGEIILLYPWIARRTYRIYVSQCPSSYLTIEWEKFIG